MVFYEIYLKISLNTLKKISLINKVKYNQNLNMNAIEI